MKPLSLILAACLLTAATLQADPVRVGEYAPDVTATDQDGNLVRLGDLYKGGRVLVYFYPKADTGGCTAQACSLRDAYAALQDKSLVVVGVSMDSVADQKAFHRKYHLPFTLIADTEGEVVRAFGVPANGRYASRQAFLIEDGVVIWRDLKASTRKQAEDVLAVLAEQ